MSRTTTPPTHILLLSSTMLEFLFLIAPSRPVSLSFMLSLYWPLLSDSLVYVSGIVSCVGGGCVVFCCMVANVLKEFCGRVVGNCGGGEAKLKKLSEIGNCCVLWDVKMFAYTSSCAKPRGGDVFVFGGGVLGF